MNDVVNYRIEVGEHGLGLAFAHLAVRFVDNAGNRIIEINGLATAPNGAIRPMGAAVFGDDIQGYIWSGNQPSFFNSSRTRSIDTLAERPIAQLREDLRIVQAVITEINSKNISYQALNTNSGSVVMTTLRALGFTVEDVQAISSRLTPGINIDLLTDAEISEIRGLAPSTSLVPEPRPDEFCFLGCTPISVWQREDKNFKSQQNMKLIGDPAKEWSIKPISEIRPGDLVKSYDYSGKIVQGRVVRKFENASTHILDLWGIGVTPGHATLCGDGKFEGQHVPILDILRTDGAVVRESGDLVRAATGCQVGSEGDQLIHAVVGVAQADGKISVRDHRQIRLGTRVILDVGRDVSIKDLIFANGGEITDDGFVRTRNGAKMPFLWSFSDSLPNPEDYILERSDVTLEEIYRAGEWEQIGTRLAAPTDMFAASREKPKPNIPPAFADHPDAPHVAASVKAH